MDDLLPHRLLKVEGEKWLKFSKKYPSGKHVLLTDDDVNRKFISVLYERLHVHKVEGKNLHTSLSMVLHQKYNTSVW